MDLLLSTQARKHRGESTYHQFKTTNLRQHNSHQISGQVLSSHSVVSSSRTVRPCSPWGIDGLDSGGRHGRRFVLSHTHRLQRRPYPICTGRSGNVRHRCGGGWAGPRFFLGGPFRVCVYRCLELKCGVLWGCPPTPRSINDLPTAPHVRCCCQKKNDELLCGGEEVACLRTYALG